ncbi:MAG TPA: D-alanyl-D-alanine carboxypeptidase [Chlorobaculum sp.]|uniref:D-alanyl-D-alanine carboxypeptidease, putative n=1 Tax=Chlorobaculum tepidum (strain ATCC 49652 / DSM 12025 / NBRC 103806 / TLS) TaxID=194439 RepID=Q8KFK2_CHLTE|nr:serine hydrolase domain-containing protein [Chlorobaculum tepidum]AAM71570.1 D-alanyl-D-alanine carboxypeptidease, putative [Chlorobaculum tepidum TLS]HBU23797.1 D-alanyl-D-alanine carboxypeptidase [Chlorobaculum sp.]
MRLLRKLTAALACAVILLMAAAFPANAGAADFRKLDTLLNGAVHDSVFPGASLAVIYRGKTVYHKAFGRLTYDPQSAPADTTTIYDAASLTKAVVTTSIAMQLVERDSLDLHAPVARYLPGFACNGKERITIEQLMRHTSGLRPHVFYAKTCRTPSDVFRAIEQDSLTYRPGSETKYSDLNFILLGRIIEKLTGQSLPANFHARFAAPLGMRSTLFNPPAGLRTRIAPTAPDTTWTLPTPRPLVNDQNAALLGGAAGHAGLFTTTGDLIKMVRMLMNGGEYHGHRYIQAKTVRMFLRKTDAPRALGWDIITPGKSSAGTRFSANSWGHLGFTGTSIWVDPEKDLAVILLSNRVWPTEENKKIRTFRPLLHDTVVECVEEK